jgi:hypothetical protein
VGTVQITASQTGNDNYNPAANISRSFSVLSSVKIKYQNGDNSTINNQIKPFLTLFNESNHAIPYNELTVKYWFTQRTIRVSIHGLIMLPWVIRM